MNNIVTEKGSDSNNSEELQQNIVVEQTDELSSHMLFTPETCRVWWKGYYLTEENKK